MFVEVAKESDVKEGGMKCVSANGKGLLLSRQGGKFYALDNTCPHRQGPLCEGSLSGKVVTCPIHAVQFDVTTGKVAASPFKPEVWAPKDAKAYSTKVENGKILVDV